MSIGMFLVPKEDEDSYFPYMSSSWKNRLREALAACNKTMQAVSLELGKNPHYITQLLNRKQGGPNLKTVTPIAESLGVSPTWLLFGEGEMQTGATDAPTDGNTTNITQVTDSEMAFSRLVELFSHLNIQQKNVFITMLETFVTALDVPGHNSLSNETQVESKRFLSDAKGNLDAAILQRASEEVRRQERELTDRAIFNFDEFNRRLKIEYNKLLLQRSSQ